METSLINFMSNIKIINKELVEYRDDNTKFIFNTPYLITRVDLLLLLNMVC